MFEGKQTWFAALTRKRSIIGDKSSHVQRFAIDVQLFHATDKLPGAKGKVVWHIRDSTQK